MLGCFKGRPNGNHIFLGSCVKMGGDAKSVASGPRELLCWERVSNPCRAGGYGSKLRHQGTAGFSPYVHLPEFRFEYLF